MSGMSVVKTETKFCFLNIGNVKSIKMTRNKETRNNCEGEDKDWDNWGQIGPGGTETDKGNTKYAVMCLRDRHTPDRILYHLKKKLAQREGANG